MINTEFDLDIRQANQYSPLALAFLGDSVYERYVREKLILSGNMPVGKLHELAVEKVCAEFQAKAAEFIREQLTEEELDVMRRGRNASGVTVPKHATVAEYRVATALECLFGYLILTGRESRTAELFELIWKMPC